MPAFLPHEPGDRPAWTPSLSPTRPAQAILTPKTARIVRADESEEDIVSGGGGGVAALCGRRFPRERRDLLAGRNSDGAWADRADRRSDIVIGQVQLARCLRSVQRLSIVESAYPCFFKYQEYWKRRLFVSDDSPATRIPVGKSVTDFTTSYSFVWQVGVPGLEV